MASIIAAQLCGEDTAKFIQLLLEYNPAPPFNAGSPVDADKELVALVQKSCLELSTANFEVSNIYVKSVVTNYD